jgi:hypothetical protein
MAVAITAVAYDKWQGYASYRAVNRTLREHGLSVQSGDLARVDATHYFDVMTDPERLQAALNAASTLDAPAAEGMYFSQDEKGMAALYTMSFSLFGISVTSWYWLYIAMYSLSVLIACIAFRRHLDVLLFLLVVVCVHGAIAHLLPTLPRQDINVIHGNRFLGIMASVAVFHLMFLILKRSRPTIGHLAAAALQTVTICLVINARTSATWLPIAVTLVWGSLWITWLFRRAISRPHTVPPTSWPMIIVALGVTSLIFHQHLGQDPAFHDGRAHGGHVFWHNLVTVLHNNPLRTERYAIPAEYPAYDDQVGYFIFDRELARRGEDRSKYLIDNSDWVYRTTSPKLDFRWDAYDRVLRDSFLSTLVADPAYVAYSFLIQQPLSALTIVVGNDFLRSRLLLCTIIVLALGAGSFLVALNIPLRSTNYLLPLIAVTAAAALPVLSAAAAELRLVEMSFALTLDAVFALAAVETISWRLILFRMSLGSRL